MLEYSLQNYFQQENKKIFSEEEFTRLVELGKERKKQIKTL